MMVRLYTEISVGAIYPHSLELVRPTQTAKFRNKQEKEFT